MKLNRDFAPIRRATTFPSSLDRFKTDNDTHQGEWKIKFSIYRQRDVKDVTVDRFQSLSKVYSLSKETELG